ncbi:L,D-transpeptidase [Nocardiopsis chromatogenes]|uniref:L,D-transpeptidase n=1 Tax=Nocardiopsis chromatogenes TaxID=280239 RepID=UPI000348D8E0|nr:Ig-like domain-containing protein [Nocardiopsis chromatogenes]
MTPRPVLLSPRRLSALGAAAVVLAAAACTSGGDEGDLTGTAESAELAIAPGDGAETVAPDAPITVSAENGEITDVVVEQADPEGEGEADTSMSGSLNKKKSEWSSDWTLTPGSDVTVTAVAENADGEETEAVSRFTVEPAVEGRRLEVKTDTRERQLLDGQTVGVGMPVVIDFDMPVENKDRVEAAMDVVSEKPTEGAWNWFGDKRAVFRPKEYWEPHQKVTVDLNLAGVQASDGVYGVENESIEFEVGREQLVEIDNDEHHMTVERDGEKLKEFPVSLGQNTQHTYITRSGVHLVMEKHTNYRMSNDTLGVSKDDPNYYEEVVDFAVRISDSGEFLHSAPWNGMLGEANTSHGCVNMAVSDSQWIYDESLPGDPVDIINSGREMEVDNGWGFWVRDWDTWLEESATGEPTDTGSSGTPGSPHGEPHEAGDGDGADDASGDGSDEASGQDADGGGA